MAIENRQSKPTLSRAETDALVARKIADLRADSTVDILDLLDRASALQKAEAEIAAKPRVPGRFKGQLVIGPEFFEPMTEEELREFWGE
jgi:hypothetical protein